MDANAAWTLADTLIFAKTGKHLNDLEAKILQRVWLGQKYSEIAAAYSYTEGHIKDVSAALWQSLSQALGEKVTKSNCHAVLQRHGAAYHSTDPFATAMYLGSDEAELRSLSSPISPSPETAASLPHFVGRTDAIAQLNHLVDQGHKVILIQGEGGLGKTTLAQHYLHTQGFEQVLELLMAKETQDITAVESVVEEWLKQDFGEEPGQTLGVTLSRLQRQLRHRRVGILIDNLEPALDSRGQLVQPHRAYVELLRVLNDALGQAVTLITSRDRLCEASLQIEHYRLPGLDVQDWQQFFDGRQIQTDEVILTALHNAYGGNAKAMGILCGIIREDYEGDLSAYWQDSGDDPLAATALQNLIASQLDRLQTLDPDAYRLLCRLSSYRYQDVPKVPTAALLGLLWDVPTTQRKRVIQSLRDRSLVECCRGEYWLHPAVRMDAIARLRSSPDWEPTHRKAAQFWTQSVQTIQTTQDAIWALEAYYHYSAIQSYDQAGQVILQSRDNQWQQFLPLGSTLYRMGLLQPVLSAITQVLQHTSSDVHASELHNILGDLYWITGNIHLAIDCQQSAIAIAQQQLHQLQPTSENRHPIYYLKMIEIDSLLSIGLYQVDLWELEAAATLFQQVIERSHNTAHFRWAEKASVGLALVQSHLDLADAARSLANDLYQTILADQTAQYTGRFAYFIQLLGQTYANLGELEPASTLYQRAIAFAETSHYPQVKAKALSGLAAIARQQHQLETAFRYHQAAIDLLDQIGAKCDLAEAHLQRGLTYAQARQGNQSQAEFEQAIRLFSEMNAPNQVNKVKHILQFKFT